MKTNWPDGDTDFYRLADGEIINIKADGELNSQFYDYALKFKVAAHELTEYILKEDDISKLDTYFFSLAFLYRHSLELILKAIGFKYITEHVDRIGFVKDTYHNLLVILETINPFIVDEIAKDIEGYNWLKNYLGDINLIDKESDSFRYPFGIAVEKIEYRHKVVRKYSIKLIFDNQTHINLVAFANKMEVAFGLLYTIYNEKFDSFHDYKKYKPIFLEQGGSYYGQSVVGYQYSSGEYYPYVKAYTESAEYLFNMMCKGKSLNDILFIPMCYLYRNAIELALKEILFQECSLGFQESLKQINKKKHKVEGLWNLVKSEIKEHSGVSEDDETIRNAESYIKQLNYVDSSSDKFRYPTNDNLELYFKTKQQFDIKNVNKFFADLAYFLSAVNTMMSVQNELKAEMEAEYHSHMESYFE